MLGLALLLAPVTTEAPQGSAQGEAPRHDAFAFLETGRVETAAILFGGDMMFDRSIRRAGEREGEEYLLSCLKETLAEADMVVANLEGPITGMSSVSVGSIVGSPENFTFTFPTTTAALLARHNIRIVSLGNNHVLNFGWRGERETRERLDEAGVGYFGDPKESAVFTTDIHGIPFAFIAYNEFAPAPLDSANTLSQVQAARAEGRIPVVYAHWGEEYVPANTRQRNLARKFVDAGAELVVGSHPHVVQEREFYNGAHIYYSLGNMIFDQYWNDDVSTGLLIRVSFTKHGLIGVEEIPIHLLRDGRTCTVLELRNGSAQE